MHDVIYFELHAVGFYGRTANRHVYGSIANKDPALLEACRL